MFIHSIGWDALYYKFKRDSDWLNKISIKFICNLFLIRIANEDESNLLFRNLNISTKFQSDQMVNKSWKCHHFKWIYYTKERKYNSRYYSNDNNKPFHSHIASNQNDSIDIMFVM